jgi:hypothetical protein
MKTQFGEQAANAKVLRGIHLQENDGSASHGAQAFQDCRIGLGPPDVIGPDVTARVEERYDRTGQWVRRLGPGPLPCVTAGAGLREVLQGRGPVEDHRDHMVHGERGNLRILGQAAVFTAVASSCNDRRPQIGRDQAHDCTS